MTWRSIHVYYHDDQTPLILDGVRPLFTRLHQQVPRGYFVRHWRQGPHVRLNFDTGPDGYADVIRPAVHEVVGGFLAARPSVATLDEQGFASDHARLAVAEDERGPVRPWYPDNSIIEAEHDHRLHVLGSAAAHDLLADFYVTTTELAFTMTERAARLNELHSLCMDLLIATAHAFAPRGITQGAISMRSHAERFLALSESEHELRTRLDASYRDVAVRLRHRVAEVTRAVDDATDGTTGWPHVQAWLAAVRPIHQRAGSLHRSGQLRLAGDAGPPVDTPFHRALARNQVWLTEIRDATWFMQYRLVLNYLYLHMTRLGVTPVRRFWLCHLIACAAEENSGMTALERLAG
jgi:hypothetical protein